MAQFEQPRMYLGGMAGRPAQKEAPPFGRKLAQLRNERGWTQPELAKRLGVTVKTVTYYERSATNPTAKTVEKIAQVFGVSPIDLIDHKTSERKPGPPSKLERLTEQLAQLPKAKQKIVVQMLEGFLQQENVSN